MINELSFTNFKSWEAVRDLKFGKITGFFGANSSGKTSIINMLLLLKQSIESPDRKQILNFGTERDYIQLGSFEDIIHNHDTGNSINISIDFVNDDELEVKNPEKQNEILFHDRGLKFSSVVCQKNKRMYVNELSYFFDNTAFSMKKQEKEKYDYALTQTRKGKKSNLKRAMGRGWPLPEPVKFYGFPDQVRTYYQNAGFLFDLQLQMEINFSKIFYLGPLREYPQRQYTWTGAQQPNDMGRKGERYVEAILAARERGDRILAGPRQKKTVEEYIACWLKRLGIIHSFAIKEVKEGTNIYQVEVKRTETSAPVLITDVGFGVSQILPVITLCYYAPRGSTLIIEQPEIHLHPLVQSALADIFIDAVQKRDVQLVIESHSEHLLRRLQLRIAEEKISDTDVNLYFCSFGKDHSDLTPIKLDSFGSILNWPPDFFGNEYTDIIDMNNAIAKRKSDGNK
jgi:predicted ATPase